MEIFYAAGLRRVVAFDAAALPLSVRFAQKAEIPVPVAAVFVMMYPFGEASVEMTSNSEGEAVKLRFLSVTDLDLSRPLCFIAEDRRGRFSLIGAAEPPYPVIEKTDSSGSSSAGRACISYEISWDNMPAVPICALPPD